MLVFFTDLDGTLLDSATYSWDAARPALDALASSGIPLILVSSKTRAEIEKLRAELDNAHPFVVENGGAAFVRRRYFSQPLENVYLRDGYEILEWGTPYPRLVEALNSAAVESNCPVTGFHNLSIEEVSALTGLSNEQAALAVEREYDEPFLVSHPHCAPRLVEAIERRGLRWTHGGRFHHICGNNDKATAVTALTELFVREHGKVLTVALGDSLNDVPMLRSVDIPVVIRTEGREPLHVDGRDARVTRSAGPAGWNEAVLELLEQFPVDRQSPSQSQSQSQSKMAPQ